MTTPSTFKRIAALVLGRAERRAAIDVRARAPSVNTLAPGDGENAAPPEPVRIANPAAALQEPAVSFEAL